MVTRTLKAALRATWRTDIGEILARHMNVFLGRPYWGRMGNRES